MNDGQGHITTEQSAAGLFKVISDLSVDDNGKYYDWQGNELPWQLTLPGESLSRKKAARPGRFPRVSYRVRPGCRVNVHPAFGRPI